MWNDVQANALSKYFSRLKEERIEWLVLRNYEGLPNSNSSKDVDMMVRRNQLRRAREILFDTMRQCGYTRMTFDRFQCIWCHSFFNKNGGEISTLKIDLFYGLVWRGVPTVDFDKIYSSAAEYNGFMVPNPVMNAFMLWVKTIMTGGKVKEKYVPEIETYANSSEFEQLIRDTFNDEFYDKVKKELTDNKISGTGKYQKEMRKISWKKGFLKHPVDGLLSSSAHYVLEIRRRICRPQNTVIALLGPDGVGKTTILDQLYVKCQDVFLRDEENVEILHFRPNMLPNLKKLLSKNYDESKEDFQNPHRAKPAGKLSSFMRLLYYWLDYMVGWRTIKKKCVNGKLILFDRYSYDFFIDPLRARISLPQGVIRLFMAHVPAPDLVFVLTAEPEVIYNRKQELPIEEIARQVSTYKSLASVNERFELINANREPDEIVSIILDKWVNNLKKI